MKEAIIDYWSRGSKGYDSYVRKSLAYKRERRAWQDIFVDVLGTQKQRILDVGTGPGIVAFQLAELGHDITAVDLSEEMLDKARDNAKRYGLSIRFEKADAETLPFDDGSFDVVINRFVLWTLPNPEKALLEWRRVVKPGGKIVYIDGNWYSDMHESPRRKRGYYFGRLLVMVTEFRNPFTGGMGREVTESLWSSHLARPEADIEMLKEIGFDNIKVLRGLKEKTLFGLQYAKYGFWSDFFLISGVKTIE